MHFLCGMRQERAGSPDSDHLPRMEHGSNAVELQCGRRAITNSCPKSEKLLRQGSRTGWISTTAATIAMQRFPTS